MISYLQNILIVPTWYCEKRCKYCFFYDKTIDKTLLSVDVLLKRLDEILTIIKPNGIHGLNIGGGGDISLLPLDYLTRLFDQVFNWLHTNRINDHLLVVSNLSNLDTVQYLLDHYSIELNVSLNDQRPFNKETEQKIHQLSIDQPRCSLTLLSVVFPALLKQDSQSILDYYESFKPKQIIFNQYVDSQLASKHYQISNKEYCEFLINIVKAYRQKCYSFSINNITTRNWELSLDRLSSADCLVTPNGQYQLSRYDQKGIEYYQTFDHFSDWHKEASKYIFELEKHCLFCQHQSKCASRITAPLNNDICPGLIPFIKFLENE